MILVEFLRGRIAVPIMMLLVVIGTIIFYYQSHRQSATILDQYDQQG